MGVGVGMVSSADTSMTDAQLGPFRYAGTHPGPVHLLLQPNWQVPGYPILKMMNAMPANPSATNRMMMMLMKLLGCISVEWEWARKV